MHKRLSRKIVRPKTSISPAVRPLATGTLSLNSAWASYISIPADAASLRAWRGHRHRSWTGVGRYVEPGAPAARNQDPVGQRSRPDGPYGNRVRHRRRVIPPGGTHPHGFRREDFAVRSRARPAFRRCTRQSGRSRRGVGVSAGSVNWSRTRASENRASDR